MGYSGGRRSGSTYEPVAKQWVRWNLEEKGKSSMRTQRVKFRGDIFQSYDTPVAAFKHNDRGEPYALITDHNHSLSTNSHLSYATSALEDAGVPFFVVPRLGVSYGWNRETRLHPETLHEINAKHLFNQLTEMIELTVKRYRNVWWKRDYYETDIRAKWQAFLDYVRITGASAPAVADIVTIMDDVEARRKVKHDTFYHPLAVAKRERARALRIAKEAFGIGRKPEEDE